MSNKNSKKDNTKSKALLKSSHDDSDEEIVLKSKAEIKKVTEEHSDDEIHADDDDEDIVESDNESDNESDEESEEEEAEAEQSSKGKKKVKESFEELNKRIESYQIGMKSIMKEISELEKNLKTKKKEYDDCDRQLKNAIKLLSKAHTDEITKVHKEKPKRKGNANGGFNKPTLVPETLRLFLDLDEGTMMARPKVMSAFNNKLSELGLKEGQIARLDKSTAKALGLGKAGDGKEIKFGEFQTFLASFYHKNEETA